MAQFIYNKRVHPFSVGHIRSALALLSAFPPFAQPGHIISPISGLVSGASITAILLCSQLYSAVYYTILSNCKKELFRDR